VAAEIHSILSELSALRGEKGQQYLRGRPDAFLAEEAYSLHLGILYKFWQAATTYVSPSTGAWFHPRQASRNGR